ncbi:hypothetical protein JR316_0010438 [Psilocybe cubensis]|uniref:DUF6535 domain-containing protein n=2 Tax=Psilocybe cubensis TaxID=181762 RepID=A0A8H8CEP4_PSICU|nr:hypothetical protein JR316_0010438 [Psilocybe cubensis]KAH9476526.1 hypothetical protein JR316_0010438 [Psilocybe cubensis]
MTSTVSEESSKADPPWICGDPLKYPLPKPDSDPWARVLEPMLEKENEMCESWRDEINNILIFAGLFSAIVSAFVVESYKGLQPDSSVEIISLLGQIASILRESTNLTADSILNGTSTIQLQQDDPQTPPPVMSRINILWFISLILSITTVLVGTVSLQWIREYRLYPRHITSRDKLALLNMRIESFIGWGVPTLISLLPVILQASVVLFLVGLIDFITIVAPSQVSIPVIAVIALPLTFITVTTLLPSCYWIPSSLILRISKTSVPSQCPYKSPQSSLFIHLVRAILVLLSRAFDIITHFFYLLTRRADTILRPVSWRGKISNLVDRMLPSNDRIFLHYRQRFHEQIYRQKWRLYDTQSTPNQQWCEKEQVSFSCDDPNTSPPLYDCIMGLRKLLREGDNLDPELASSSYYCVQDLFKYDRSGSFGPKLWHQYLQGLTLDDHSHTSLASHNDVQQLIPSRILQEETLMTALTVLPRTPENVLALYEHHIRLFNFYLTLPARSVTKRQRLESTLSLLSRERIEDPKARSDVSRQYTMLLEKLFETYAYQTTPYVFRYQNTIQLLDVAFRAQDDADRNRTLQLIYSHVVEIGKFSSSPIGPQYLLYFLMASYVGLVVGAGHHFTAFGRQMEESLILQLVDIGNSIRFDQLTQSADPSQWGYGYKIFVEQAELQRLARYTNHTRQANMHWRSHTPSVTQMWVPEIPKPEGFQNTCRVGCDDTSSITVAFEVGQKP